MFMDLIQILHLLLVNHSAMLQDQSLRAVRPPPTKHSTPQATAPPRQRARPYRARNEGLPGHILPRSKKIISPFKYRKTFQIKSPLKPKKLKYSPRAKHIHKSQSFKREINENDIFNQKYIPLLRSVGMLFDNILGPDARDSYEENKQNKYKRTRYYSGERDGADCPCALTSGFNISKEKSRKETNIVTAPPTTEISTVTEISSKTEVATATTDNTAIGDVSSLRQHTDLPILFPRNSLSGGRDYNGFSKRSSTAHNGSFERYIARDNGNSEYIPGSGEKKPYSEGDEANTDGDSRDSTSGNATRKRLREYRSDNGETNEIVRFEVNESETEATKESEGDTNESQRQDQLEMDRNKTESAKHLSKPFRRLQGATPKTEIETISELPTSTSEESIFDVTFNSTSIKRVSSRGSALATENKKIHPRHEAVIPMKETNMSNNPKPNKPVVVIIDGYSVMRNRNGEKKLARKAIHINPE
ncbi:hypothetical protein K1T71_005504 [Dendrolimus kikuchii]|uniref:Uncharacterized protein n=1 Tax=Dendrolimus kikuchii TaxID=765133 RepID=A0ACC1D468_9NEOP|nr:hypothetical protein K1T71_005504 [Dendrolimus kikuchii]